MEFATLTKRAATHFGVEDPDAVPPRRSSAGRPRRRYARRRRGRRMRRQGRVADATLKTKDAPGAVDGPRALLKPIDHAAYETVTTLERLDHWIARAHRNWEPLRRYRNHVARCACRRGLSACRWRLRRTRLVTFLAATSLAKGFRSTARQEPSCNCREDELIARLKPLLEDEAVLKIGQNLKYDYLVFLQRGISMAPFDDTMLISYVLDAGLHGHGMDELSELHLGHKPITFSEVAGTGKDKTHVRLRAHCRGHALFRRRRRRHVAPARAAEAAAARRGQAHRLRNAGAAARAGAGRDGARGNRHRSRSCCASCPTISRTTWRELETEIHKLAGGRSTSARPSSSATYCSASSSCPAGARRKTGAWSTDADVLEEMAAQGHDLLAKKVLDWRQLAKLRGTYTDALPGYINPQDRARAHLLRDGVDLDRAARLHRSQSAEHPHPHPGRPAHPPGVRRA